MSSNRKTKPNDTPHNNNNNNKQQQQQQQQTNVKQQSPVQQQKQSNNAAASNNNKSNAKPAPSTTTAKPTTQSAAAATSKTAVSSKAAATNTAGKPVAAGSKGVATPTPAVVDTTPQLTDAERAYKSAKSTYDEQQRVLADRTELRAANKAAFQQRAVLLSNLDSSIKRCTGFKNKLQNITQTTIEQLKNDITQLNLTKYIDEIAGELGNLRVVKNSDVEKFVYACSALHQRYDNFTQPLLSHVTKQLHTTSSITADDVKTQKVAVRLYLELLYVGLTDNCGTIMQYVAHCISNDTTPDNPLATDDQFIYLTIVIHFLRHAADELLGITSHKMTNMFKLLSVEPLQRDGIQYGFVTEQQRFAWNNGVGKYVDSIKHRVTDMYKAVKRVDKRAAKQTLLRGEPLADVAAEQTRLHEIYDKFVPLAQQLCDVMAIDDFTADLIDDTAEDELGGAAVVLASNDSAHSEASMYIDADEQQFYENLADLRLRVPPLLLTDASDKDKRKLANTLKLQQSSPTSDDGTGDTHTDSAATSTAEQTADVDAGVESIEALDENVTVEQLEQKLSQRAQVDTEQYQNSVDTEAPPTTAPAAVNADGTKSTPTSETKHSPIDLLLQEMTMMHTNDAVNEVAEKFCYLNNKPNRQKLVDALYYVHWSNADVVVNYARLVATLHPYMPEIGKQLIQLLQSEFYYLLKQKTAQRYETRVKNMRYIVELTKFHVCPPIVVLTCLHACILQFSNYSVPVISTALEYCGYWLHKNPITGAKFNQYVDTIKKVKAHKFLDLETSLQLDNALTNIVPRATAIANAVKQRSIIHQYIRYLLYTLLTPRTTEAVLKHMRCLPWQTDDTVRSIAIKCFCNVYNMKYNYVACLASVLSGLDSYHNLSVYVVDSVLNELYTGQLNADSVSAQYQRQIVTIKYLGELYAYKLVDTQTIFDTLYRLVQLDGDAPPTPQHAIFNVRLVMILLDVVGKYFDHGALKKRLERFLLYLQRYVFTANTLLPIDIEFGMVDLFTRVKPSTARHTTASDAQAAIEKLETQPEYASHKDVKLSSVKHLLSSTNGAAACSTGSVDADDRKSVDSGGEEDDSDDDDTASVESDEADLSKSNTDIHDTLSDNASEDVYDSSDEEGDTSDTESSTDDSEIEQFQRRRVKNKDDELDQLFDRMMTESVESRKYDTRTGAVNMVPSADIAVANMDGGGGGGGGGGQRGHLDSTIRRVVDDDNEYIAFKLITRGGAGNKQSKTGRELLIPMDTDLALSTIHNEQYLRAERDELKKLVLAGIQREAQTEQDNELQRIQGRQPKKDGRVDLDFSHREYDPSAQSSGARVGGGGKAGSKGPKLDLNEISGAFPEFKSARRRTYGGARK